MEKLFNYRPLVLAGIVMILGILCGYYINITAIKILSIIAMILIIIVSVCLCVFNKKFNKIVLGLMVQFLIFIIGFTVVLINAGKLNASKNEIKETNSIECTITLAKNNGSIISLTCENIVINSNKVSGSCKISYLGNHYSVKDFSYGAKLKFNNISSRKIKIKNDNDECIFNFAFNDEELESVTLSKNIFIILRNKITNFIVAQNTNDFVSGLEVGMLFGEKAYVGDTIKDSFSVSGLSHLLAVSGLHVGFLLVIMNFVLNKLLKSKTKITLIIEATFLIIYAFICDFSPSVVRASVMAIISMYALVRGRQYDGLNALCLSAIILLFINPFTLFDVGFQLSFACVFSLFCLTGKLNFLFSKVMPLKLSSSLAVGVSATAGTFPIISYYFGSVSLLSILVNLVAIPFASVCFILLVVCVFISMCLPFLSFIMAIPNFLYKILARFAYSIADLKFASVELSLNFVGVLLFSCAIIVLGDYLFIKEKYKFGFSLILVLLCGMVALSL
ncbi:MAG: ComEC/Rec2 family competence protein [Christensenellales bacterium]